MTYFTTPTIVAIAVLIAFAACCFLAYLVGKRRAVQAASELASLNESGRQLLRSQLDVESLCEMVYWQAGQIVPSALFQLGLFEGDDYHVIIWLRDSNRLVPRLEIKE